MSVELRCHVHERVEMSSKQSKRQAQVDRLADTLESGEDVTLGLAFSGSGGHVLLATDVRGEPGSREFLVHDSAFGEPTWISEADLVGATGSYRGRTFSLDEMWFPK